MSNFYHVPNLIHENPFPYEEEFEIYSKKFHYSEVIKILEYYFTEERKIKLRRVSSQRSCQFIPVLEKFFDNGNLSAVFRTAESLGFHHVYSVDNQVIKHSQRISKGADKWLNTPKFANSKDCILHLKKMGFKVLATHLSEDAKPLQSYDFSQPTAILFGSEGFGVSNEALQYCDENMLIPMHGLTQSYNVSVAASICMYHAQQDRIRRLGQNSELNDLQKEILYANFLLRGMPDAINLSIKRVFKIQD